jgi:hypothetical protein
MVILLVDFEMFGQITDSLAQKGDLNFGGAGIAIVKSMLLNDCLFCFSRERQFPYSS